MIKPFKLISFLEGVSYLLLLFVATPIKHFGDDPSYVKMLGMPHGILFLAYIVLAFMLRPELKWDRNTFLYILIASIIPFGTFYVTKKYI